MNRLLHFVVASVLAMQVTSAWAADAGVYTIVDGDVRVLRGTMWYRLTPGARVQDGDIVEGSGLAQLQVELTEGRTVSLQAPVLVHVAIAGDGSTTPAGVPVLTVQRGWLKAVAKGKPAVRVRLPSATADVAGAIVVAHAEARVAEVFVESGTVKMSTPSARGKDEPRPDARGGEFVARADDRAPTVAGRPPEAFIAAMPRQFRDALPSLAHRFRDEPGALSPLLPVTLAEAEPWLAGASRRGFVRRFSARLSDPVFRAAVSARPALYPEWDRVLHPEKFRPKETGAK